MSVNSKKNKWSWSLIWSYVISVTIVYLAMEIIFKIANPAYELNSREMLSTWGAMILFLIPVLFIAKKNNLAGKAVLLAFLIYLGIGVLYLLIGGFGSWGGTTINYRFFRISFSSALAGAICTSITILLNKLFSKS